MSLVHLHLMLNHAPIIGVVFAALLLAIAAWRRSDELIRVALGFLALLGAVTVVVFATGGAAEDAVAKLPTVSRAITERHEDAAVAATVIMTTVGALAVIALVAYRRRPIPRVVIVSAIAAVVASIGVVGYTANLGGQIRHTEIRAGASAASAAAVADTAESLERGDRR